MLKKLKSFEALVIFGLYLIPVILWSLFGFSRMSPASHWTLFSMGLTLSAFGGVAIWILTSREDKNPIENQAPLPEPLPVPEPIKEYIPSPVDAQLKKEKEMLEGQIQTLKDNFSSKQETDAEEQLHLKECLEKAEKDLDAKTKKIKDLELKIDELDYEIKALIDYNQDTSSDDLVAISEQEAGRILKKWLNTATSMQEREEGKQGAEKNLSRLIQGEPTALVFLYHKDKGQVISSNSHTLTLFGLTPEQFAEKFHTFIPKESLEWHTALNTITDTKWTGFNLKSAKAVMGQIPKGPLKGSLIGIAY